MWKQNDVKDSSYLPDFLGTSVHHLFGHFQFLTWLAPKIWHHHLKAIVNLVYLHGSIVYMVPVKWPGFGSHPTLLIWIIPLEGHFFWWCSCWWLTECTFWSNQQDRQFLIIQESSGSSKPCEHMEYLLHGFSSSLVKDLQWTSYQLTCPSTNFPPFTCHRFFANSFGWGITKVPHQSARCCWAVSSR